MLTLTNYIQEISKKSIIELNSIGYSKPGHNGPYNDLETPVRNTAHRLFLLSKLAFSKDSLIIDAANKRAIIFVVYLLDLKIQFFIAEKIQKKIYLMVLWDRLGQ